MKRRAPRAQKWEQKNGKFQPVLLERHVVKEIVERLWFQGKVKVWVINQPVAGKTAQNEPGIPDLVGWLPRQQPESAQPSSTGTRTDPLPLYIEVKRPGGRRSFFQERFISEAKEAGCAAFFAECWADVVRELSTFGLKLRGDQT
jgi:VRR-NUC domain